MPKFKVPLAPDAAPIVQLQLGTERTANGSQMTISVAAEGGKANAALIALLAREWHLPKRDIAIVVGMTDRRKLLHIACDPVRLLPALEAAVAAFSGSSETPS